MLKVQIKDEIREFDEATPIENIAQEYQQAYPSRIVLAKQDGRLRELFYTVGSLAKGKSETKLDFVTMSESIGTHTYLRSVIFLMLKAFRNTESPEIAENVYVDFSVSNGLFCRIRDHEVTEEMLERVSNEMHELVRSDIPFLKRTVSCREAVDIFSRQGMPDKKKLFEYRRASEANLYALGEYQDYYYAYLVPSTGYLKEFRLFKYKDGFVLQRPTTSSPDAISPFVDRPKLFETLRKDSEWCDSLGLNTVGDLNDRIVHGEAGDLLLLQEAIMEKQIGDIAQSIKESGKRVVLIAGPSSSGKTTFSHRLSIQLQALGLRLKPLACDDYFINRDQYPLDENGEVDFESIRCVDTELLNKDLTALMNGEEVALPSYNFLTGEREYKRGRTMKIGQGELVMLEGIHCLNEELTSSIPRDKKFKIYISALMQLNIDEHNYIPTTDVRLLRRIVRDSRTRGYSAGETISRWASVRRGEEKNIFPYQESSDVMMNSALIYELAVIKPYAEPLLFSVERDSDEYLEAKRLLKFLDYILTIPSEDVPANSLVREFIGGGCFDV